MTYLILPDIHLCHNKAEKIIKHEACDNVVFVGDYKDDFHDDPTQVKETAEWLSWSVNQKNRVHLVGNHDVSYINKNFYCSGWTQWKQIIVSEYCNWENTWSKLQWYYNLDNTYLLTHAGLDITHVPPYLDNGINVKTVCEWLKNQAKQASVCLRSNRNHWFYKAGFARGGNIPVGGIVWCDFRYEFQPIPNVQQIFAHTALNSQNRAEDSFIIRGENCNNINLDTVGHLNRYAVYDDRSKTLLIKYYADL